MFRRVLFSVAVSLGLLTAAAPAWSQEKKDQPASPPKAGDKKPGEKPAEDKKPGEGMGGDMSPEMQAQMEAAMKAMMPGPPHQKLAKMAGEWTTQSKMVMMPDQPPDESEGSARIAVMLDGRFIHEEYKGVMMGSPFTSVKVLGYNNGSKKYEGVWTYTMGTAMMTLNGTSDDDGKTIKCKASWDNEIGVNETMDIIYKMGDDDHFTVTLQAGKMPDGSDGPVMEVKYTRKK